VQDAQSAEQPKQEIATEGTTTNEQADKEKGA
jgi:hypothetical protein